MGFGGIGVWQLLIILVIIVLLFGTKKLRGMGTDVGGALKNFKSAMKDSESEQDSDSVAGQRQQSGTVIDSEKTGVS